MSNTQLDRETNPPVNQLPCPTPQFLSDKTNNFERLCGSDGATYTTIKQINSGGSYPQPGSLQSDSNVGDKTMLRMDYVGNLMTRGPVTTDEGSFREGFPGSAIYRTLTGSFTFTTSSATVTLTGSDFYANYVSPGDYIRLSTDTDANYVQIASVDSLTQITLLSTYAGTGGTGTCYLAQTKPVVGTGGSIAVASSQCTIGCGTTASSKTYVQRLVDYSPFVVGVQATISQRIANLTGYIGMTDDPTAFNVGAWFRIDGTSNTTVVTETALFNNDKESYTVSLPSGTTNTAHRYRIEVTGEYVNFFIDETQVATHRNAIPQPYAVMSLVCGWVNGTTPASTTNMVLDFVYVNNANALQIAGGYNTAVTSPTLLAQLQTMVNAELTALFHELIMSIRYPPNYDMTKNAVQVSQATAGNLNVTAAQATAGNLNCTATIAANQDIRNLTGTVAAVTSMVNVDTYQGRMLMTGANYQAWANCCRSRIA